MGQKKKNGNKRNHKLERGSKTSVSKKKKNQLCLLMKLSSSISCITSDTHRDSEHFSVPLQALRN